jgi:hypothetical protein
VISNLVNLTFDQTSADKRDRYQSARMLLSQESSDFNNRAVEFRLEERIPNTNQWRVFAEGGLHPEAFVRVGLRLQNGGELR